jgi:ssDNA-binding Zn-finger/Zn-ribbon topoisomerase 1
VIIGVTVVFNHDFDLMMAVDKSVKERVAMTFGFNVGVAVSVLLIITALLILALAYVFVRRRNFYDFPIQLRSRLLFPAEKNFFEYLVDSFSDDFYIFTKVAMLDVVEASTMTSKGASQSVRNRLNTRCFDFVLCKKHDLSIFCIVELENVDAKKSKYDKAVRKKLIAEVCKSAGLKLFHFDVMQNYHRLDIRRLVTGKSSKTPNNGLASVVTQQAQFTVENFSYAAFAKGRRCPQCNGEVVTKVALKGKTIGEKALMCRKYPYCDYRVALSDEDVKKFKRSGLKSKNRRLVKVIPTGREADHR